MSPDVRSPLLGPRERNTGGDNTTSNGNSTGSNANDHHGGSTFKANLGTAAAYGILVSIVIGSGVFTSPGSIDTNVPSPGMALVIWLLGGVLAWSGASTLVELSTAIPGEGGVQPYLQYIFGDVFGFLSAWTWIIAVMPATLAILSVAFVETVYSAFGITNQAATTTHKLLSVLTLLITTMANSISTKVSTNLSSFFLVTKFTSIILIVAAGLVVVILQTSTPDRKDVGGRDWFTKPWFGTRKTVNQDGSITDWDSMSSWDMLGHYSAAIYGALWAYSGWDKAIYISSELTDPSNQLPLTINTAIPTIFLCFFVANASYYILLPWDVVSTSDSVAVTAIGKLLGTQFGIATALLICLVIAGSILGNSLVLGRMTVAAAKRGWFPRVFTVIGRLGPVREEPTEDASYTSLSPDQCDKRPSERDAPMNALALSVLLSSMYILMGDFRSLLTFNGLGEYTFFFLAVVGALVLRWREPELRRPYKPFIAIPMIFAAVSGFVIVRGATFAPVQALVLSALWLVGLGLYWVQKRRSVDSVHL